MEEREYIILNVSEIDKIDFTQVMEDSVDTLSYSLDGSLTFVKYVKDNTPSFINELTTKQGPYTNNEILEILSSTVWREEAPDPLS
jgi:hypothetical protein